jgi:anthranilate synthase component 1
VHHIVSNVEGELRAGATPADVIRAFPDGTIAGAFKVRACRSSADRARRRLPGSLGYINATAR